MEEQEFKEIKMPMKQAIVVQKTRGIGVVIPIKVNKPTSNSKTTVVQQVVKNK